MTDYPALLSTLIQGEVEFILIGGVAATAHGSARFTKDVDIVYRRSHENLERIVSVLKPLNPYLRDAPPGLPFPFDVTTLQLGLNFTLITDLGAIDLLGEVVGGGDYEKLYEFQSPMTVHGVTSPCISLEKLIKLKIAAGRPKDFDAVAELQNIWDELNPPTT
ncbi:hypothetical protein [Lacunimicrobium album]